jgi:hypothetical protein
MPVWITEMPGDHQLEVARGQGEAAQSENRAFAVPVMSYHES